MPKLFAPLALLLLLCPALAAASDEAEIDIPYTRFVLDNGLRVIVHEDHKAPIVAVNVWYHVGSKNEKPGKTGFAHLFEHLMFNGSENYDGYYREPFEAVGATGMNGTTNTDRTNYFENVPNTALETALFLESDRMGHLLGAITQEKLDRERGVVQNEKRQRENQPYGQVFNHISENTYPVGHPYSWSTIGSMEDLNAASLEDVHEWFKTYYGAANAVVSIAGAVDTEEVRAKVERYFGDIPAGPPVTRPETWIAPRTVETREALQDRVPQARVVKVWNVPQWGTRDGELLSMATSMLASGKTSRLYKRLVYEEQIAANVTAFAWLKEIGGHVVVWATALPGQDPGRVEAILDEELGRFLEEGPTEKELSRVKTQYRARFVRGIERIGGFGGKSDILAESEVYGGSPDFYKQRLAWVREAGAEDLRKVVHEWLSRGAHVIEVHPFAEYSAAAEGVDRSSLPEPEGMPEVRFASMQRDRLSNGLEIILVERDAVPVLQLNLLLDAGYAADQGGKAGTANLAMDMLDEGTASRTALAISEELDLLGATLSSGSNLDQSFVNLSALKENLDPSLAIFADVLLAPSFPAEELERRKKQQLARIQREKTSPFQMGLRVFPRLLYGRDHAYGLPFTGSGTEASLASIERQDLVDFHRTWFRPGSATLVAVGDIGLAELKEKLEGLLGSWKPGEVPAKNIATVEHAESSRVYLVDRPGSSQSIIFAGHVMPPRSHEKDLAIQTMNSVLGGASTARINSNLRRDKHWSYGAQSVIVDARGQRPFLVFAPVQSDKTMESMREIQGELEGIVGSRPPSEEELGEAKNRSILTLPGRWETAGAIVGSIVEMVRFGLDDSYWDTYPKQVAALDLEHVERAGEDWIHPDKVVWVVVGDREKIEGRIRELDLGEIHYLDADGEPLGEERAAAESP